MLRVLSRCLIYKVHTALQRQELFYHTVSTLSRAFFRFFKLFSALRSARQASPYFVALAGDLIILPHLGSLVKNFFRTIRWFFVLSFKLAFDWKPRSAQGFVPCVKRLLIISDRPRIVNCFFQFFSSFFLDEKGLQDVPFFLLFSTRCALITSPSCKCRCSYPQYRKRNP